VQSKLHQGTQQNEILQKLDCMDKVHVLHFVYEYDEVSFLIYNYWKSETIMKKLSCSKLKLMYDLDVYS